jgi:hypothetical protein
MFIRNLGGIAAPFTHLIKKDVLFIWTTKEQETFKQIKKAITDELVMRIADLEREFKVKIDALNYAIKGQLIQKNNNRKLHFIAFYSKKFTKK